LGVAVGVWVGVEVGLGVNVGVGVKVDVGVGVSVARNGKPDTPQEMLINARKITNTEKVWTLRFNMFSS
jgi:hypothetical protein